MRNLNSSVQWPLALSQPNLPGANHRRKKNAKQSSHHSRWMSRSCPVRTLARRKPVYSTIWWYMGREFAVADSDVDLSLKTWILKDFASTLCLKEAFAWYILLSGENTESLNWGSILKLSPFSVIVRKMLSY